MDADLERTLELYHDSIAAFVTGDCEAQKPMWSRRDEVTLANPLGPPARGPQAVFETMERAAAQLREGERPSWERISQGESGDMAYIVEIERTRVKPGGSDELLPIALRVTSIFGREEDGWKLWHRHADPLTAPRTMESVMRGS